MSHASIPRLPAPSLHDASARLPTAPGVDGNSPTHDDAARFAIFDAVSDIVCICSIDGTLQFLNRAGKELLGLDDASVVGMLFPAHTPAARALLWDEVVPTALRVGQYSADTALQTADGRIFPATQHVVVSTSAAGPLLTIVIRDVNIERHAAARLSESQRLFEMIARNSPDLMYLYDPIDQRVVWMNRCIHAFLGGTETDARTLSRKEMHRMIHREERAQFRHTGARMASAYGNKGVVVYDVRVQTPGNGWRWLNTRATVFSRRETGAPLLLLGIATDITARKNHELRLVAERDAAEQASNAKTQFVAHMTDEFSTALHAIIKVTSDVRDDRDRRLTAREHDQLDEATSHCSRLLETVCDLHDFSAIESGEFAVEQSVGDVRVVIRDTIAAFSAYPAFGDFAIRVVLPEDAAPLLTDPVRLRQALTHLLGEACASSTGGPITVSLVVQVDSATPVAITVHVAGAEIAADRQSHLFVPFAHEAWHARSRARHAPRSGLGLALAQAICEVIGCALTLTASSREAGATFRIALPISSRAAQLASAFAAPAEVTGAEVLDRGEDSVRLM